MLYISSYIHDKRGQFCIFSFHYLQVFGLCKETGAPRLNPQRQKICKLQSDKTQTTLPGAGSWGHLAITGKCT